MQIMSIRKKIMLGFLCLGAMLALSGMISLFELNRLSSNTQNLLESSMKNMSMSKTMLDAIQKQNTSLLQMIVLQRNQYDSVFLESRQEFEAALANAKSSASNIHNVDAIANAKNTYYTLIDDFFMAPGEKDILWFMNMYGSSYLGLTSAIKAYMISTQENMISKAESLERNAYRAIMPGIITLCVAILIVLIFAFMVDIYYIKPIQRITAGLNALLQYKLPYNVQVEGDDEIAKLNHQIDELAAIAKKQKNE